MADSTRPPTEPDRSDHLVDPGRPRLNRICRHDIRLSAGYAILYVNIVNHRAPRTRNTRHTHQKTQRESTSNPFSCARRILSILISAPCDSLFFFPNINGKLSPKVFLLDRTGAVPHIADRSFGDNLPPSVPATEVNHMVGATIASSSCSTTRTVFFKSRSLLGIQVFCCP